MFRTLILLSFAVVLSSLSPRQERLQVKAQFIFADQSDTLIESGVIDAGFFRKELSQVKFYLGSIELDADSAMFIHSPPRGDAIGYPWKEKGPGIINDLSSSMQPGHRFSFVYLRYRHRDSSIRKERFWFGIR